MYVLNDASRTLDVKDPGIATERETPSENVLVTSNYHMEKKQNLGENVRSEALRVTYM